MTTDEEVALAELISRQRHTGQVDKQGRDYILHVERVVAFVEGNAQKVVAWLHDVIEDTPTSSVDLYQAGISIDNVISVVRVTKMKRPPGMTADEAYERFIRSIKHSGDPVALTVKIADVHDHLTRPDGIESMRPRYERAMQILTGGTWKEGDNGQAASAFVEAWENVSLDAIDEIEIVIPDAPEFKGDDLDDLPEGAE